MNIQHQKTLSSIEQLIAIQRDCVDGGSPSESYMRGMLNGLICAHSAITGDSPNFHEGVKRKNTNHVRHKSQLTQKRK